MSLKRSLVGFTIVACMMSFAGLGLAEEEVYTLTIKNHEFSPKELVIPAKKKVKILVDNQDATPEEFESYELNREKVVTGNNKITLFVGPLKPGTYKYFGEFHKDTAQGVIKAEE